MAKKSKQATQKELQLRAIRVNEAMREVNAILDKYNCSLRIEHSIKIRPNG